MPVRPLRLLALESATDALSVAVLEGERVVELEIASGARQHSAMLLPVVDATLRRAGIALAEIEAMAISAGPGSFTSLRIGLATLKGLAFGRSILSVGVSTLEAMAAAALAGAEAGGPESVPQDDVLALLDARRGEVYAGAWRAAPSGEDLPVPTLAEGLYSAPQLVADLRGPVVALSPDAAALRADLEAAGLRVGRWIEGEPAAPRADWVGRLGARRLARGEGEPAATLCARYVRRAQAEAQRLGQAVEDGRVERTGGG